MLNMYAIFLPHVCFLVLGSTTFTVCLCYVCASALFYPPLHRLEGHVGVWSRQAQGTGDVQGNHLVSSRHM